MTKAITPLNIAATFEGISGYWQPLLVGQVNDMHVKLAKLNGEFVWHSHPHEDELFLVLEGTLLIRFRDYERTIRAGEFIIVPRGVEHLPIATDEVRILLFESATASQTGSNVHAA